MSEEFSEHLCSILDRILQNVRRPKKTKLIRSCVCVLRPVSVFCVLHMLGANTMLGTMDNIEFINVLSLNTIFVILQVR